MSCYVAEAYNSSENNSTNAWQVSRSSVNNSNNNKQNANPFHSVAALGVWNAFYWSVVEAYFDCVRNKTTRPQTMEYIPTASVDIPRLAEEIWSGVYKPSTSTCFMVTFPKLREVFAAAFRDRVVHHWICLRLVPVFEDYWRRMGNMSHACRLREAAKVCRGRASPATLDFYRSSLNSYLGIMRGTRSHNIISRAFAEVDECFYRYFEFVNGIVKIKKQAK